MTAATLFTPNIPSHSDDISNESDFNRYVLEAKYGVFILLKPLFAPMVVEWRVMATLRIV